MKKYKVTLTGDERRELRGMIAAGKAAAKRLAHARVLLEADAAEGGPAWPDARIAEAAEVSPRTVERVRQRFVELGWRPRSAARGRTAPAARGSSTGPPRRA
jgi:hypothetical protein